MRFSILLAAMVLSACTPPAEPPPVEPTATTATTTAPPVEPPVEPPPEPGKIPEEYPLLDRTPGIIAELTAALQENAWGGWRDPLYVADKCAWALKPNAEALFPMTHDEMQEFARAGAGLDREGAGFVARLPMVNKRCAADHPEHDPRFCQRSDVQRLRLTEFRGRLTAHLETARSLRDGLRNQAGYGEAWNSIKGWCENQQ